MSRPGQCFPPNNLPGGQPLTDYRPVIGTRPHSPCYLLINALGLALCHKFSSLQRHLRSSISASLSVPASRRCTIHSSTACRFTFLLHTLLYSQGSKPPSILCEIHFWLWTTMIWIFFWGGWALTLALPVQVLLTSLSGCCEGVVGRLLRAVVFLVARGL